MKLYSLSDEIGSSILQSNEIVLGMFPDAELAVVDYRIGSYEGTGYIIILMKNQGVICDISHCSCFGPEDGLSEPFIIFNSSEDLVQNLERVYPSYKTDSTLISVLKKVNSLELEDWNFSTLFN